MARLVKRENAIWSLFVPINSRLAPETERLRSAIINKFYDRDNEPVENLAERFHVGYRVMDLINKTELKSLFIPSIEWFEDYATVGSQRLKPIIEALLPFREKILRRGREELTTLGVPGPTITALQSYMVSDDLVNVVSAMCAHVFLACLNNLGNRSLEKE